MSNCFAVDSGVRQGCRIAPDLFLGPMDYVMERTVHREMTGVTLEHEIFTDLDFADDVALLAGTGVGYSTQTVTRLRSNRLIVFRPEVEPKIS